MSLINKKSGQLKSSITKVFIIGFSCNLMYVAILGLSGKPIKNALGFLTTLSAKPTSNNFHFLKEIIAEDSTTIFYNLGWEAYKKNNYNSARYNWEKGSLSAEDTPDKFNCLFRLGLLQQVGEGVNINLEAAFNFYMKASYNGKPGGNVDATKNIGTFYENGMFVKKDNKKALEWYTKAKDQGNKYCEDDIARVKKNIYDLFEDLHQ